MSARTKKRLRRLNNATHRDLGYFFSSLVVAYCLSGMALNHIDHWNPDFILHKETITLDQTYAQADVGDDVINTFGKLVGEHQFKMYGFPTADQVKIYYENASLHVYLARGEANYERITRRPLFYQTNVLHRNSLKGWKWVSDVFAAMLIVVNLTGLFVLKGKYGIQGRGKWLIAAGFVPPLIALIIQANQ
ncbi:MAG: PepSY-associated TM helix domain-containing protein [Candidatus Hydrogenedentes bacterium]|nr:PepSY-associated TM helix domain-containing protein [Candidatus Hydrogenedentota bacterium]